MTTQMRGRMQGTMPANITAFRIGFKVVGLRQSVFNQFHILTEASEIANYVLHIAGNVVAHFQRFLTGLLTVHMQAGMAVVTSKYY